jgi:ferritin-like metal-binding protein YciE
MPKVTDPNDLLLHDLATALTAEREIQKLLTRMSRETNDREVKDRFKEHASQTREHVKNVQEAFKAVGARQQTTPAPAIEGIEREYDAFAGDAADDVTADVLDLAALSVAAQIEHAEISLYEGLIAMARAAGQRDALGPLQKNLKDEQAMLRDGKAHVRRLSKQALRA